MCFFCHPSEHNHAVHLRRYTVGGRKYRWRELGQLLCRPNIAVAKLAVTDGRVVLVNSDRAVSCHRWLSPRTDGGAFTFSGGATELVYGATDANQPVNLANSNFDWHTAQFLHHLAILSSVFDTVWDLFSRLKNTTPTFMLRSRVERIMLCMLP